MHPHGINRVPVLVWLDDDKRVNAWPDNVRLFSDEEISWVCFDGEFQIEFESDELFKKKTFRSGGRRMIEIDHHDYHGRSIKGFKYTITIEGAKEALDPDVEADPRKRPKYPY